MKKIFSFMLVAGMAISFAACGGEKKAEEQKDATPAAQPETVTEPVETVEITEGEVIEEGTEAPAETTEGTETTAAAETAETPAE